VSSSPVGLLHPCPETKERKEEGRKKKKGPSRPARGQFSFFSVGRSKKKKNMGGERGSVVDYY